MIYVAILVLGILIGYAGSWLPDPAFRYGFFHPFGPPRPWWSQEKRADWYWVNGYPWESK